MAFLLFVLLYLFATDLGIKSYAFTIALFVVIFVLGAHYRHMKNTVKRHEKEKQNLKPAQPWEKEN